MRNLKALGLALMAAMALGAVAASPASATIAGGEFTAKEYPAHVVGQDLEISPGKFPEFTSGNGNIGCTTATYTGQLAGGSPTVDITPNYEGCSVTGTNRAVTVTMNGCFYRFHVGTGTTGGDWHGTADLVCPAGQQVEVHVYSADEKPHEPPHGGTVLCTFTMDDVAQNQNLPVTYTDSGNDSVVVDGTVKVTTETHGFCNFGITRHEETDLHITATVEGSGANEIDIGTTP